MRIVYAGTPDFAATALAALIEAAPTRGWTLALVLSQPDRPAGRGLKLTASAVKRLALERGLTVDTPETLSLKKGGAHAQAAHERLRAAQPDVLVVAAYGLLLPQAVLDIPRGLITADGTRISALNIHGSLLPRWRGAAPVARAIEAGDTHTGITIMQMEAGLDTGPMLLKEALPIEAHDTSASLTERLAACGARLIVQALDHVAQLRAQPQPEVGVTYAHKLDKREAALDFALPATVLERKVRALNPFPGATVTLRGETLKVWATTVDAAPAASTAHPAPGTVLRADASGIYVACAEGVLVLTQVQRAGARRMSAREMLAGLAIAVGERFDRAPAP